MQEYYPKAAHNEEVLGMCGAELHACIVCVACQRVLRHEVALPLVAMSVCGLRLIDP